MPSQLNDSVIEDAISDALLPDDPGADSAISDADAGDPIETQADDTSQAAPEPVGDKTVPDPAQPPSSAVPSPAAAAQTPAAPQDDFEKKFGIPKFGPTGRENRIPHSRVVKINEKAVKDARTTWETEAKPKFDRLAELEPKITDYEARLTKVQEFENVMLNDHVRFLQMLNQIPAYNQIFTQMAAGPAQTTPAAPPPDPNAGMPAPDVDLPDGQKTYSPEGQKKLVDWIKTQAKSEAVQEVSQQYKPIKDEWEAAQQRAQLMPIVNKHIATARQWSLFNENEPAIVQALNQNPNLSLEGAYIQVVGPKLAQQSTITKDREAQIAAETRAKVLAELEAAPTSTAAPRSGYKPGAPTAGKRTMEEIIAEQVNQNLR